MRTIGVILALTLFVGCTRDGGKSPKADGAKPSAKKPAPPDPLEEKADPLTKEINAMTPIAPVDPAKLLPFLPTMVPGYVAEEPIATYAEFGGEHKYSYAKRKFSSGNHYVLVDIQDAAHISHLYSDIPALSVKNEDTLDGYEKGLDIDGNIGFERYDKLKQTGKLTLMVAKRHLVTIEGEYIAAETLRKLFDGIDVKALAALK